MEEGERGKRGCFANEGARSGKGLSFRHGGERIKGLSFRHGGAVPPSSSEEGRGNGKGNLHGKLDGDINSILTGTQRVSPFVTAEPCHLPHQRKAWAGARGLVGA